MISWVALRPVLGRDSMFILKMVLDLPNRKREFLCLYWPKRGIWYNFKDLCFGYEIAQYASDLQTALTTYKLVICGTLILIHKKNKNIVIFGKGRLLIMLLLYVTNQRV